MHCVREEHSAVNMNLHYLENGTVMLNFIYRKELFFLPLGFALKVGLAEYISLAMQWFPVQNGQVLLSRVHAVSVTYCLTHYLGVWWRKTHR